MTKPARRVSKDTLNEHAQLWHYRNWAEWMAADSWSEQVETG